MAFSRDFRASDLTDHQLVSELRRLYRQRGEVFFEGDARRFRRIADRMSELEGEYASRHAQEMRPAAARTRAGARLRAGQPVDGGGVRGRELRKKGSARRDERPAARGQRTGFAGRTQETTGPKPERRGGPARAGRARTALDVGQRTRGAGGARRSGPKGDEAGTRSGFSPGRSERGKRTGRGRGVPGPGESFGRRGGVSGRGSGKHKGAANRTVNNPSVRSGAVRATVGGRRRPKGGMQG